MVKRQRWQIVEINTSFRIVTLRRRDGREGKDEQMSAGTKKSVDRPHPPNFAQII